MQRLRTLRSIIRAIIFLLAIATNGLTATSAEAAVSSQALPTSDPPRYTGPMPPIGVAVVSDGRVASGSWSQTIRLRIRSGGSVADPSMVVFGGLVQLPAIFAAPPLTTPAL